MNVITTICVVYFHCPIVCLYIPFPPTLHFDPLKDSLSSERFFSSTVASVLALGEINCFVLFCFSRVSQP